MRAGQAPARARQVLARAAEGRSRRRGAALLAGAVLAGVLVIAPAAGADDPSPPSDAGTQPEQGVTYAGHTKGFTTKVTAVAPTSEGGTQLIVDLRVECGDLRGKGAVDETVTGDVEPDGSFSVESDDPATREDGENADIHLQGRFDGSEAVQATVTYDVYLEDDEGSVSASCDEERDLELTGGRANRGLQLVEAGVAVEPDDADLESGETVASADAVFVVLTSFNGDGDSTELFRIDPTTNTVAAHATVPVELGALVATGSSLWGVEPDAGTVFPVDPIALTAGAPVPIAPPRTGSNDDFALFPGAAVADGSIWLAATASKEIVRFDPASGSVVARYPIDAYPADITAGPTGLYVETQTSAANAPPTPDTPETNVVRRIDPANGATLATSPAYEDDTVGGVIATADGVVATVVSQSVDEDEQFLSLDPDTLAVRDTAPYQYAVAAAPPGVWTAEGRLRGLLPDLTTDVVVPHVADSSAEAGVGFEAIWVYNSALDRVYRIATHDV